MEHSELLEELAEHVEELRCGTNDCHYIGEEALKILYKLKEYERLQQKDITIKDTQIRCYQGIIKKLEVNDG